MYVASCVCSSCVISYAFRINKVAWFAAMQIEY